jgi:hypothetical protein
LHGGSWWKEATVGLVGHVAMHFVFTVNYFSLFKGLDEPIIFLCI